MGILDVFAATILGVGALVLISLAPDLWRWYGPQQERTAPDVSWCRNGGSRGYVTVQSIEWWIGKKESGWLFIVPIGTEFESSVPWWLKWLFSPDDPFFLKAAAIHDTLLEDGYRQAFADSQWFEAALSVHAPGLRARGAYAVMRARRLIQWVFGLQVSKNG